MKRVLYSLVVIVSIAFFDVGFQWFVKTLIIYYKEHIFDTRLWYFGKLLLFFIVIGLISYFLHLLLGGISNVVSGLSPSKLFSRKYISIVLFINGLVWLYGIWIAEKHPYDVSVVILNILLTVELFNFTAAIFVGHTVREETPEEETPELTTTGPPPENGDIFPDSRSNRDHMS